MRSRLVAMAACCGLGLAYGGVVGGGVGGFLTIPFGGFGLPVGLIVGALGGLIGGLIACRSRGIAGWVMGGAVGGALTVYAPLVAIGWTFPGPPLADLTSPGLLLVAMIPAAIGAFLGRGVGAGIQAGTSTMPGVPALVRTLAAADAVPSVRGATELTPAGAPEGRGDEPAPS